jgi:hypothetical protein
MESESPQPPLKVCPHCSVASRTDADTCPSCGKPYTRPGLRLPGRGVWIAVAIIVAAFGLGYGVTKLVTSDSEESGSITFAAGNAVKTGVSESEFRDRIGGEDPSYEKTLPGQGNAKQSCLYYAISDRESSLWQFCFVDGKLVTADAVK